LNPRAAAAQTELARLNLASGRTEAGVQFARDAVTNQPRNTAARVLLIRGLIAKRDYERASTELAPLVKSFPDHPTIKSLNGALLLARNDVAGARQAYEEALQKNAGELDALSGLATIEARSGQLDRSRARLSEQLGRTPDNTPLLTLAAQVDLRAGDFASGEQRLRRVIQIDPANQRAYALLAQAYLKQKKLDEARQQFEGIAQREPKSVGAYIMIGTIFDAQNRPDDAARAYRRALELDPGAPVAANNLAYGYAERNENLEEALALARAAAERLKDQPDILDTLGWIYYRKNQTSDAISHFDAAVAKDPSNSLYHYHRALALLQRGDDADAKRAFEEALRLNPAFPGADDAKRRLAALRS
jgi:tetratricopeptide (TPR) repeat protein